MKNRIAQPFINGIWINSANESSSIVSPYSGAVIGKQIVANQEDVENALEAAMLSKKHIGKIPAYKRSKILKNAASLLKKEKEYFAKLISLEIGKPLKNTLDEVSRSIDTLEQSAEEANRLRGETLPGDVSERGKNSVAVTFRVPVGVVAAITPFNAPLNLICHKIGPAFAGGNSIILKPAPQATLVATEFLKLLLKAGFPEHGINMVLGGADVGNMIVSDERVDVISFTGGIVAARKIMKSVGIKKVLLELGGNAATIVHEDADIERAAKLCVRTGFSNSGQSCISVQRIYVHSSVMETFSKLVVEETSKIKVGDPLTQDVDIGTVVDISTAKRIESWVNEAVQEGAELIYGGGRRGATVYPTVLRNTPRKCKVVCEEVFGPVINILPYQSIEEAVTETNESPFGLQTGLFTNQMDLAYKVASAIEAGGIVINGTSNYRLDHWPYGGIKNSGIGREGPRYAIKEMTELKMLVFQDFFPDFNN